jgi:hypothetical protein
MAAPKGNKFWLMRSKHGRDKIFVSSDKLWAACCEYFEWVDENPLYEAKAFSYQGETTISNLPKMRAMTLAGLCLFLDISRAVWNQWKNNPETKQDFLDVITRAEEIMASQKFSGAAADLLNANIIARDLGLTDKKEVTSRSTVKIDPDMKPEDAARAYQDLMGDE